MTSFDVIGVGKGTVNEMLMSLKMSIKEPTWYIPTALDLSQFQGETEIEILQKLSTSQLILRSTSVNYTTYIQSTKIETPRSVR